MKRFSALISAVVFLLSLCACGGNTRDVILIPVSSEIYSQEEIEAAAETVIKYFHRNFSDCTLKELRYAGDNRTENPSHYGGDEAIVLDSVFDVGPSGGDGSLSPNTTQYFSWILVRTDNGPWRHVDHGYG